jgi:hypothetical protein
MRMLCVELEQNIEAHYCRPAPNGEVCRPIYTRQPGKIQCRWGIECRQTSCHHWMKQGHPPGHALLKTQTETPSWTLSSVPDCRHLRRSGRCFHRDGWCRFAHWDLSAAAASVEPWLVAAADAIPITSLRSCDTPSAARQRAPRASRGKACAVFRRFLLDTFGIDRLRSGGGVLDVAGGAGSLSFELVNLNEVPCVIVDPRHPCFRRARQVVTHRRRQWAATADRSMLLRYDHQQTEIGEPLRAPLWLQAWFGPRLYDDGSPSTHMPDETSQQDDARGGRPPAPEPEPAQLDGGQLVGNAKGAGAGAKGGRGRRTGEGDRLAAVQANWLLCAWKSRRSNPSWYVPVWWLGCIPMEPRTQSWSSRCRLASRSLSSPAASSPSSFRTDEQPAEAQSRRPQSMWSGYKYRRHPEIRRVNLGFSGRNVALYHFGTEA